MADRYYQIKNYSSTGEMAISRHAFENIALNTIKHIKGVKVYKGRQGANKSVYLYRPIVCNMEKDGLIKLDVDITLKKGVKLKETCEKIQEEINNAILLAVETVKVKVNINVAQIEQ